MLNTYLSDVLETFSSVELNEFQLFLESPYFNRGQNAERHKRLLQWFLSSKKEAVQPPLTKEEAYRSLFPDNNFIEGKIDKLLTEFKKVLHQFIVIQRYSLDSNETAQILDLSVELRVRGLEERYQQSLEKAKKRVASFNQDSIDAFSLRLSLAREEHEFLTFFNKAKGDLNIPSVIEHLEDFYFSLKTEMLNLLLLQKKFTVLPEVSTIPSKMEWIVPQRYIEQNSLIGIAWKIHNLLKMPSPSLPDFQELLESLHKHGEKISPTHIKGFYAYLRNFCTILIESEGHFELRRILYQIYVDNLNRGYFHYDGQIPSSALLNIVQIALSVGEHSWTLDFLNQNKGRIIGENATDDFYRMNLAICLFYEKKYAEALDTIPFGSSYSFYHLMARRLELKIYYELDSDLLPYKIDAFKMFISRAGHKILSENLYELYLNFINFLRQLSLSPLGRDKLRAEKMIARINEKKLVAERTWLLEKARELGERKK